MLMGEVRAEGFLRAIDPVVRAGLSLKQEDAIRAAARQDSWKRHPVDIRLALTSPVGRFYLALVCGRERRSSARLAIERNRHLPVGAGNTWVLGGVAAILMLAGFGLYSLVAAAAIP
jgi:hypothetical protein